MFKLKRELGPDESFNSKTLFRKDVFFWWVQGPEMICCEIGKKI